MLLSVTICVSVALLVLVFSKKSGRAEIVVPIGYRQIARKQMTDPDQNDQAVSNFAARQIVYLHSKDLLRQALGRLDYAAGYFQPQFFRDKPLTEATSPVKILILKNDLHADRQFEVDAITDRSFVITVGDKKTVYRFGQKIIWPDLEFILLKPRETTALTAVALKINNLTGLTDKYYQELDLEPVAGDPGKVSLSLPAGEQNAVPLLLTLRRLFFENNRRVSSTKAAISYLTRQLDSLDQTLKLNKIKLAILQRSNDGPVASTVGQVPLNEAALKKQLDILRTIAYYVKLPTRQFAFVPNTFEVPDDSLKFLIDELNNSQLRKQKLAETEKPDAERSVEAAYSVNVLKVACFNKINRLEQQTQAVLACLKGLPDRKDKTVNKDLIGQLNQQQLAETSLLLNLLQKRENLQQDDQAENNFYDSASPVKISSGESAVGTTLLFGFLLGLLVPVPYFYFSTKEKLKWSADDIIRQVKLPLLGTLSEKKRDETILYSGEFNSVFAKQLSTIRAGIERQLKGRPLIFTSLAPGTGKSFLASQVAIGLAYAGKKTLLIQTGANPQTSNFAAAGTHKGLSNYLGDHGTLPGDVICPAKIPGLWLITPGVPEMNNVLTMNRMASLLKDTMLLFDHILIDGYPMDGAAFEKALKLLPAAIVLVTSTTGMTKRELNLLNAYHRNHGEKDIYLIINHLA
ncbi:hypothetical protein [Mucilaginibacter corticis]|uniref:hypothetical protein n=1 Tax=Mucilaginibacter corticis TaxID=2597670 RepID=UPI001642A12A|nr:hypothetical protein [Mucilaginibacter corticis]